jgi:mersacidin/lichenicidin family type 2 lantibiotic
MYTNEVIQAWKDPDYREVLLVERRIEVPEHPSGVIEFERPLLADESSFEPVVGGKSYTMHCTTIFLKHCK